jgi:hypothetical protein
MSRWKYILITVVGVALLGAVGAGQAIGQNISYSGSVQYASGSYYFTERTGSLYFNNGMGVSGEYVSVYINIPLVLQNTPWVSYSVGGVGWLPSGGPHNGLVDSAAGSMGSRRGNRRIDLGSTDTLSFAQAHFGDPSLSGRFKLFESTGGRTSLNGTVGIKFPLTDPNSGFGTGAWDMGTGLAFAQRFQYGWLIFASGSYWRLGDMDELDFNNIFSYGISLGRSYRGGKLMAVVNIYGSTQVIDVVDPPVSAGAGIGIQLSTKVNINSHSQFGLTESASDFSIGLGWSVNL